MNYGNHPGFKNFFFGPTIILMVLNLLAVPDIILFQAVLNFGPEIILAVPDISYF